MSVKPFVLCVRMIIFDQQGHILLLRRSPTSKTNPSRWELPGGKIEPGEPFDDALRREILEETGFTVAIHTAAGTAMQETEIARVVNLVMIGTIISGGMSISSEHDEYRWVNLPEIAALEKADWFTEYYTMYMNIGPIREESEEK